MRDWNIRRGRPNSKTAFSYLSNAGGVALFIQGCVNTGVLSFLFKE